MPFEREAEPRTFGEETTLTAVEQEADALLKRRAEIVAELAALDAEIAAFAEQLKASATRALRSLHAALPQPPAAASETPPPPPAPAAAPVV